MERLPFDKATFQSPYFLKTPIFSKQLYISASATFSEDVVYWNSWFSTANLVFKVTLFRSKFPGVHRMVQNEQNEQKFYIKFAFQGIIEQDYLPKHVKIQFLGCQ